MLRQFALASALMVAVITFCVNAGPLTPPAGPVAPTAKPLAEIEPRIAINDANTPGDANSRFRITQPGSYYLTANVTGVSAKHGIEISSSNVTIDLNGFTLSGVPGALKGITVDFALENLSVRNGVVINWPGYGVDLRDSWSNRSHRVEDVTVRSCAGVGILTGSSSIVNRCIATNNTQEGIVAGNNSTIRDSVARSNGWIGIAAGDGSTIKECTSEFSASSGFYVGTGGIVESCTSRENTGHGIMVAVGARVTNCTASLNDLDGINAISGDNSIVGCTTYRNTRDGISITIDTDVRDNNCNENGFATGTGAGIFVNGSDNRIEGNHCSDNDWGIRVSSAGSILFRNTCSGNNLVNWDLAANNVHGPILDRTAPASPAVNGNAAADSSGSTHPNANFSY